MRVCICGALVRDRSAAIGSSCRVFKGLLIIGVIIEITISIFIRFLIIIKAQGQGVTAIRDLNRMAIASALNDLQGSVACGVVERGLLGNVEHRVAAEIHHAYECHACHCHDRRCKNNFQHRKARSATLQR